MSGNFNTDYNANPAPCPGYFTTYPCMLNSRQVLSDASSLHQNIIRWLRACTTVPSVWRVPTLVGLIHKTTEQYFTENEGGVDVLPWIKTVDLQSQCHWKLGEQQLNSSTVCALLFISMSIYPLSAANTRRSTDAGLILAQRLRRWTNINQALVQIIPTAVSVARLVVIWCVIYMWLGHVALFLVDV